MEDDDKSGSRLSRWSKRKIAVAREEADDHVEAGLETASGEQQPEDDADLQAELQANREVAEAIDLENLDEKTDFSVFMKAGVPEMLKKQAMATLWRTNPVFANVDGLVDYDDDFASPDLIMKSFKSAYQAGRGYLDLFKEEAEEDLDAAPDEEIAASDEQEENLLVVENDDENEPLTEVSPIEESEALVEADELQQIDEEPVPKVSLRERLELDRQS